MTNTPHPPIDAKDELFELCKEVHKRTGWETPDWYDLDPDGKPEEYLATTEDKIAENTYIPYYTSDYLLERLNNEVELISHWKLPPSASGQRFVSDHLIWTAKRYRVKYIVSTEANASTPLKALLKLTIALHDAGELK